MRASTSVFGGAPIDPVAPDGPARDRLHAGAGAPQRRRLFVKYVAFFVGLVGFVLIVNGALDVWFSYDTARDASHAIMKEKAQAAAQRIAGFVDDVEQQLGWTTLPGWAAGTLDQRRFDYVRILRQVPAITELSELDRTGSEQLKVSRIALDVIGSGADFSHQPQFTGAMAHKVWFSPVYFRNKSEPYMTVAMALDGHAGVTVAEVNLKLIWDVVRAIKVGASGYAYVVDPEGKLIAHPDISLVLRDTDFARLPQVAAAMAAAGTPADGDAMVASRHNWAGHPVLAAHASVRALGWIVFVELPLNEALQPLYAALERSAAVLLLGFALAVAASIFLARRMVVPIQVLQRGAARIGAGDLGGRIEIHSNDELEGLADQFNDMAGQLQASYAELEGKVEARTAELSEALEQQTATAEVLQVINSSPGELVPVFEAMLDKAIRLCEASSGMFWTAEGERFRMAACRGTGDGENALVPREPYLPACGTELARIAAGETIVNIADLAEDPAHRAGDPRARALIERLGARAALTVALRKDDALLGSMVIYRQEVRPFTEKQIALLENFAAQAVIAMENARLLGELRQRTSDLQESLKYQTATSDVLKVISRSTVDLQPVLETVVATAAQLCRADQAIIYRYEEGAYRYAAGHSNEPDYEQIERETPIYPDEGTVVGRTALQRRTVQILDSLADPLYATKAAARIGNARTMIGVPLMREGALIGVIALARGRVEAFSAKEIELVTTFADQAVIAIENARLIGETREAFERTRAARDTAEAALGELKATQANLIQAEKMASLGQLTAGIAHEIKNPLNFVNNFAGLSVELLAELKDAAAPALTGLSDAARVEIDEIIGMLTGNLQKIGEHGRRADGIVKSMLLHSRSGGGERQSISLNALVEESLNLAFHGARAQDQNFNITLERDFDGAAAPIELVPQDVTRVFLNLFGNGFYAANKRRDAGADPEFRPVLKVTTRDLGDAIEVRVRDNGIGMPPEVRAKLFTPFFTTKPTGEGTGLGLSISYDIVVKQHGGTIDVDSRIGEFTEFIVRLPRYFGGATALAMKGAA